MHVTPRLLELQISGEPRAAAFLHPSSEHVSVDELKKSVVTTAAAVGLAEGEDVGKTTAATEGWAEGLVVGNTAAAVGLTEGAKDGWAEGLVVGASVDSPT